MSAVTPEPRVIDARTVLDLMDEAVDKKGRDYIYTQEFETCQNFDTATGDPKCIVGHVLHGLGVTYQNCGGSGAVASTMYVLRTSRPELTFTLGAVMVMQATQFSQDSGVAWGQARDTGLSVNNALSLSQSALPWDQNWV